MGSSISLKLFMWNNFQQLYFNLRFWIKNSSFWVLINLMKNLYFNLIRFQKIQIKNHWILRIIKYLITSGQLCNLQPYIATYINLEIFKL